MCTILCCKNIQAEMERAIRETRCPHPVVWIDAGLHNTPKKLRKLLQGEIDNHPEAAHILLGFGFCGNALVGLTPGPGQTLVLPRADDCITLLLGSRARRAGFGSGTYFLSKGWMDSGQNMWREYEDAVTQFGQETADSIYDTMLAGYRDLVTVDTGVCDAGELEQRTGEMAAVFGLTPRLVRGDDGLLRRLLTGDWSDPEAFVLVGEGRPVELRHLLG